MNLAVYLCGSCKVPVFTSREEITLSLARETTDEVSKVLFIMSENLNASPKKSMTVRELFCFVLLFAGLLIIMTPASQRKHVVAPVAKTVQTVVTPQIAASNAVAVVGKTSWSLGRFHFGSIAH